MGANAITYKENGYEAILVEYNVRTKEDEIVKGFYHLEEAEKWVEDQSLHYQQSGLFEIMTVDEALEKGL